MKFGLIIKAVFANSGLIIISGILLILLAVEFYNTGRIKEFFPLGEGRMPMAIFTFLVGIWLVVQGSKMAFNNYNENKK